MTIMKEEKLSLA